MSGRTQLARNQHNYISQDFSISIIFQCRKLKELHTVQEFGEYSMLSQIRTKSSLYLSVYLSVSVSLSVCICQYTCPYLSVYLFVSVNISDCICRNISRYTCPYLLVYLSVSFSILSVYGPNKGYFFESELPIFELAYGGVRNYQYTFCICQYICLYVSEYLSLHLSLIHI